MGAAVFFLATFLGAAAFFLGSDFWGAETVLFAGWEATLTSDFLVGTSTFFVVLSAGLLSILVVFLISATEVLFSTLAGVSVF